MEGDYEGISVTARALVQWSYHHYSLPLIQMGPYKERNENSVILSVIHGIYIGTVRWDINAKKFPTKCLFVADQVQIGQLE